MASSFQPFEGATNKTAVVIIKSHRKMDYPVPYVKWAKNENCNLETSMGWAEARRFLSATSLQAEPIGDSTSPWIVSGSAIGRSLKKITGASVYKARLGVYSSPTGVFWVRVLRTTGKNRVFIENEYDSGKQQIDIKFAGSVESDCVWPLARGRDLTRWSCKPSGHIVVAHDPGEGDKPISLADMKRKSGLFDYFGSFEKILRSRKNYQKYFDVSKVPYWAMFNVGPYTFAPFKVGWRYIDSGFRCAVFSGVDDQYLGHKLIMPDGKLVIIPFEDKYSAHFVCALLNSSPAQVAVTHYAVSTQIATHVTEHVAIPQWNNEKRLYRELADLSIDCHARASRGQATDALEERIDVLAGEVWGLTVGEMKSIRNALVVG